MDILNDDVASPKVTTMDRILVLYTEFKTNVADIDNLVENINNIERESNTVVDNLEDLYRNEFTLYMNHIGIYEDLINLIDNEPRTVENEFELARIKKEAKKVLRVGVIEI